MGPKRNPPLDLPQHDRERDRKRRKQREFRADNRKSVRTLEKLIRRKGVSPAPTRRSGR